MIDSEVLDSTALKLTNEKTGAFLLPQAFPEGYCVTRYGSDTSPRRSD